MNNINIYERDYLASRAISKGYDLKDLGYDHVYYQNNELILNDLLNYLYDDKNILSVLSSADQVLTFRALGARCVDTFDFNRLTIYYYYLRKWSIKYMNDLYPNIYDNNYLKILLSKVIPSDNNEKKALDFYKRHLKDNTNLVKLFYDIDLQPKGESAFSNAKMASKFVDDKLIFYNLDLFNKDNNINNTYDYIFISNILEWARDDINKLKIARDNLNKLLNNNGIVLCSKLINNNINREKEIFDNNFIYDEEDDHKLYTYMKR